jgi:hypothetical protein
MSWLKWLPWRFVIRRVARAQGFLDPIALQARLQQFTQPSEVAEPIELLRAGAVFHARGLINSRVIQHNLDWVWPYWAERQFDPEDDAFVPRAFSITHRHHGSQGSADMLPGDIAFGTAESELLQMPKHRPCGGCCRSAPGQLLRLQLKPRLSIDLPGAIGFGNERCSMAPEMFGCGGLQVDVEIVHGLGVPCPHGMAPDLAEFRQHRIELL